MRNLPFSKNLNWSKTKLGLQSKHNFALTSPCVTGRWFAHVHRHCCNRLAGARVWQNSAVPPSTAKIPKVSGASVALAHAIRFPMRWNSGKFRNETSRYQGTAGSNLLALFADHFPTNLRTNPGTPTKQVSHATNQRTNERTNEPRCAVAGCPTQLRWGTEGNSHERTQPCHGRAQRVMLPWEAKQPMPRCSSSHQVLLITLQGPTKLKWIAGSRWPRLDKI